MKHGATEKLHPPLTFVSGGRRMFLGKENRYSMHQASTSCKTLPPVAEGRPRLCSGPGTTVPEAKGFGLPQARTSALPGIWTRRPVKNIPLSGAEAAGAPRAPLFAPKAMGFRLMGPFRLQENRADSRLADCGRTGTDTIPRYRNLRDRASSATVLHSVCETRGFGSGVKFP